MPDKEKATEETKKVEEVKEKPESEMTEKELLIAIKGNTATTAYRVGWILAIIVIGIIASVILTMCTAGAF